MESTMLTKTKLKYEPGLSLRDYQREGIAKSESKPAFAYTMAMRTGKTLTVLTDWAQRVHNFECAELLVIAPGGVYRTWVQAIQECLNRAFAAHVRVHAWESGMSRRQVEELNKFLNRRVEPRIFLVNVEALSLESTGARDACEEFLRYRPAMIVIDESTIIKNHRAKRTKYINTTLAPMAEFRRILSGLPTPRSPLDLFSQFEFLDLKILGFSNFWAFRNRYAIMEKLKNKVDKRGRPIEVVVGHRNEEELQRKIAPYCFRVPFRPEIPSTYSIWEVKMTPEQQKVYKELKQFATARLSETAHVTSTLVITQMLRLHQVLCGHVVDEDGQLHILPENRTSQLLELLDDYHGKAIIWCSYDLDVRKITEALEQEYGAGSVARFWGGNEKTREQEEKEFKTNPHCRWMIATPSAGGRGRTWDCADLVVYYSSTNNLEHRDQSEQRAQNVGKKRQVDYIDLIVPNTVETKILRALRNKMDMAALIVKDNWREWLI